MYENPLFSQFAIPAITGTCTIIKEFFLQGKRLVLPAGSILSLDGKMRNSIFYIEQGEMQVVFNNAEGQQRTVIRFGEGGIFNIAPAALEQDASGEFQALRMTILYYMPADEILNEKTIQEYPEVALVLIRHLSRLVLIYHTLLTDLQVSSFFTRFCRYLFSLHLQHGCTAFPLGTTQDELAAILGVHRATLARAIRKSRSLGMIGKFNSRTIEILDLNLLQSLAVS